MENKIVHLELIHSMKSRIGQNLVLLRATLALAIVFFSVFTRDDHTNNILFFIFPVVAFWLLDGYLLSQKRLLGALYTKVQQSSDADVDFSMDVSVFKRNVKNTWLGALVVNPFLLYYLAFYLYIALYYFFGGS